jgi:repressor LexA
MKRKEAIEQADFSLKVQGFSMFPLLQDSDIVFVRKQNTVEDGQLVVVRINNNEAVIKRFYRKNDEVILKSENPEHETIRIKSENCEVIGVINGSRTKKRMTRH